MILKVSDLIELSQSEKYSDLKTDFKIIHPRIGDVTLGKHIGEIYFFFDMDRMRHMKKANINDHVFVYPKNKHADKRLIEFLIQKEENMKEKEIKGEIWSLNKEKTTFNTDEYHVETKENGQIVLTPKLPKGEFSSEKLTDLHLGREFWVKVRYENSMSENKIFLVLNEYGKATPTYLPAWDKIIKTAD